MGQPKALTAIMALALLVGALWKWPAVDIAFGVLVGGWISACLVIGFARGRRGRGCSSRRRADRKLSKLMDAARVW